MISGGKLMPTTCGSSGGPNRLYFTCSICRDECVLHLSIWLSNLDPFMDPNQPIFREESDCAYRKTSKLDEISTRASGLIGFYAWVCCKCCALWLAVIWISGWIGACGSSSMRRASSSWYFVKSVALTVATNPPSELNVAFTALAS